MCGRVHQPDPEKLKATVKLAAGSEIEVTQDVAADLKATVTQLAKDRTVTGTVEVEQADPADLKATVTQAAIARTVTGTATVTQAAKDRTVTNPTAANLKAEVAQTAKDRTVTCDTAANLKGTVTQLAKDRTVTGTVTSKIKSNTAKDGAGTDYSPLLDADGHLQVDVLSGGAGGTEYTEGDTDATITGGAALAEGDDDTLTPLQVDAAKNLKVNVVAGGAGGGVVTQDDPAELKATVYPDPLSPLPVIQLNYNLLQSLVHQQAKDRTVTNAVAANLKAEVAQTAKDRTVTNATHANLKGRVQLTDKDGIEVVSTVTDQVTGKTSIATSRGAGKSTFTEEYFESLYDVCILLPAEGLRLMIVGVDTGINAVSGDIELDFDGSEQKVWRHYGARFKSKCDNDMSIIGDVDEPLVLNSTQGENNIFVMVNYREIEP